VNTRAERSRVHSGREQRRPAFTAGARATPTRVHSRRASNADARAQPARE
jgi:hypothetical protein